MGRRGKIDMFGLTERVVQLYNIQKKTIAEIADILNAEDFDISREAVRTAVKSAKEIAANLIKYKEEAKVIIDTCRNTSDTDLIEAITDSVAGELYNAAKSFDAYDFKNSSEYIQALSKLADSKTKIAKMRLSFQKGSEAAKEAILKQLETELEKHPDILEKITSIVRSIKVDDND